MPSAEDVLVRIGATSAALDRELARTRGSVKRATGQIGADVSRLDNRMRGAFGRMERSLRLARNALFLFAGGGGLGLFVTRSLDAADSIGKTADSIGVSTDALQEYRFAADLSGVSQEKLDKALTFFTKTLGEAKLETGELVTILKKYDQGLLDTLRSQGSVEDKLQEAFRALARTEDAFIRNALAAKLFGRGGVAMVNMVRSGADALEDMRREAREVGIVLDEALIRKAEESKDRLTTLKKVISANATVIGVELAPALINITALTAQWASGIGELVKGFDRLGKINALRELVDVQKQRIDLLRRGLEQVGAEGETLLTKAAQEKLREAIRLWQAEIDRLAGELAGKATGAPALRPGGGEEIDAPADKAQVRREAAGQAMIADLDRQNALLTLQLAGLDAEAELVEKIAAFEKAVARDILPEERATLERILGLRRDLTAETEEQAEAEKRVAKALAETEALIERARDAARPAFIEIEETARRLDELLAKGDITAAERAALLAQMQAAASQLAPIVAEVEDEVRSLELAFMDVGDAAADALESFIFEGGKAIDVARALALEISRIGFNEFVRGPLRGGITDLFSGAGSFLGGAGSLFGGGGAAALSPAQQLAGGLIPLQHGGRFGAGETLLVGERRPEIIRFDRPGQVFPSVGDAARKLGETKQSVQVVMNINAPVDVEGFRRARSNLMAGAFRDASREARRRN